MSFRRQPLSVEIRTALNESGGRFTIAQQRRLFELADATESAEQVTGGGMIGAMTTVLYSRIRDEYRQIAAASRGATP